VPQAALMDQLIAESGPFLPKRERWVLRQVKAKPTSIEVLARMAKGAPEYWGLKRLEVCISHDVNKLVERGLVQMHDGVIAEAGGSGGAAQASTPL
jgi:hypothetical protein